MAFPTAGVLDNFNRVDAAIGSAWSGGVFGESSTWSVSSNQAGASGSFNSTWWNAGTFGPDCEVYATLGVVQANTHSVYLGLRTQTPGSGAADCYEVVCVRAAGTDTINVYRVDNGAQTLLGSAFSQELAAGDAIGLEAVGSTITLYYKASGGSWTSLGTRTDTTYAGAGYVFMGLQSTAARWDDFGGGLVVAGGGVTGTAAVTLPPLTASASGVETFSGTSASVLPGLTVAASGGETFSGTASAQLPGIQVSATGTQGTGFLGTAAVVLPAISVAAAGAETISGTASIALPSATAAAAGLEQFTGTAALALPSLIGAAAGAQTFAGMASVSLPVLTLVATGTTGANVPVPAIVPPVAAATNTGRQAATLVASGRYTALSNTGRQLAEVP